MLTMNKELEGSGFDAGDDDMVAPIQNGDDDKDTVDDAPNSWGDDMEKI